MSHTQQAESAEWTGSHRGPPTQRHRQANGRTGVGEGVRSGWRPCQQHSQAVEAADDRQNHRHGNQQQYRRHESSGRGGGRPRGHRGLTQEGGAQQQPRPGVTRYRRAQQNRHKQREQGEAESHRTEGGNIGPTVGSEEQAVHEAGPEAWLRGDSEAMLGPPTEVGSLNTQQFHTESGGLTSSAHTPNLIPAPTLPPHVPDHSNEALDLKFSKRRQTNQQGEERMEQTTKPNAEPNTEPTIGPHAKPTIEPCAESNAEPSTESYSCTERNTECETELCTDVHWQQGQGCEEIEGEWEGEWVRQTALQVRRAGLRLFEQGGLWQRHTVGSRLHHYNGLSDGESDSPEKEPELPVSPWEQDGETVETAVRRRQRSWSLDRALGEETDWPESEQASHIELGPGKPQDEQASQQELGLGKSQDGQASQGVLGLEKPQDERTFQGELKPDEPQDDQASQGELGLEEPQDERAFQGVLELGESQDGRASQGELGLEAPQDEQTSQGELGPGKPQDKEASQGVLGPGDLQDEQASEGELGPGEPQDDQAETEVGLGEQSRGMRDSLSLAIKDIKEAIQEVKTRTVRSPYTPEEPMEPVWVMRQDLSPTVECDLQPSLGSDSLDSGSPSPLGAESTNRQPLQEPNCSIESPPSQESMKTLASFPTYVDVPGPCDPEDLIDGIIFAANYLGSTQLLSDKTPSKSVRMTQAQEAVSRIRMAKSKRKCQQTPEVHTQVTTEVDLFISTQRIKVLNADSQETMMDHPLRTISYIADIGDIVVLMARRKRSRPRSQEQAETSDPTREGRGQYKDSTQEGRRQYNDSAQEGRGQYDDSIQEGRDQYKDSTQEGRDQDKDSTQEGRGQYKDSTQEGRGQYKDSTQEARGQYRMICHVFESEDAQLIAQSIGQAFSVAYQEFLRANGINPEDLSQREYSDLLSTQDMYNDDLIHFSKSENCKDVNIAKQKGEVLGVVVVESGWGSILPTVIIASMMHGGPAEKSGHLNIGDQIMSINGTSLVGLPLTTCQSIIKALKSQPRLKLNIVRCPPVTTVLIRRPDLRYQLGFSVQNGIICSLMRGGIAERGGVRVGHRIIEISGQSVVATPHERIVNILSSAVGEIHMKTMPAAMYRLLTGQEQPVYI